ncbi:hypothetical protein [Flavobacterium foetidum]|uniref:hypothetical protein n=1 Tax=Flavobacterium foetidum TaxID=2026681 RepID=UPI001074F74B|nr:hypothetical protein [Flavobacterium foetidum]KAF2517014.1 hypothetical protein E0W73_02645 [Flavobacterium foetidum]
MAYSFYSHLAFLPPSSNADLAVLKNHLETFYARPVITDKPKIILNGKQITVTFKDGYNFYIYLSEEKHVNQEALEIAEDLEEDWNEKPFDKEKLKASNKRFELWGDQDFDMDYFNDSLFIVNQIEKFDDVIIFQNH